MPPFQFPVKLRCNEVKQSTITTTFDEETYISFCGFIFDFRQKFGESERIVSCAKERDSGSW